MKLRLGGKAPSCPRTSGRGERRRDGATARPSTGGARGAVSSARVGEADEPDAAGERERAGENDVTVRGGDLDEGRSPHGDQERRRD